MENKEFYNKSVDEVYKEFSTSLNGLTEKEAQLRLSKNGQNKLAERKKTSNILLFLNQFSDFMVILLICASIFSFIVSYIKKESYIDSIISKIMVLLIHHMED